MPLHGNRVYKITSDRGIQYFFNFSHQYLVLTPASRIPLNVIHIFDGGKRIKSKLGKYLVAIIEGCLIIMHRVSLVAQIFHIKGHTLAGRFLQDCLVRIFTRAEEIQIHGTDTFKLCIGCAGSYRRNT